MEKIKLRKWVGIAALAFGLMASCTPPKIKEIRDFNGDGISDVFMTQIFLGEQKEYLSLGDSTGKYKTYEIYTTNNGFRLGVGWAPVFKFYQTPNGKSFVFDGQFFREHTK